MTKRKQKQSLDGIELFGWYGALAIVGAYLLVTVKLITSDSIIFHLLNMTGSIGIVMVSLRKKVYQPVVLNGFRVLIGVVGIIMAVIALD